MRLEPLLCKGSYLYFLQISKRQPKWVLIEVKFFRAGIYCTDINMSPTIHFI